MLSQLTAPEWLIIGLLVVILGRIEASRWLATGGVLLICYALYYFPKSKIKS